jgi:hypothetical protein
MARVFDRTAVAEGPRQDDDAAGSGVSVIRLLAATMTALFVSFLVVTRSQAAMQGPGARAESQIAAGGVRITDDDAGRSLFQLPAMAPDRPEENCIAVTYSGTVVPAVVRLKAKADGALAESLDVKVEEGEGGTFGSCGDFSPTRTVFTGTLASLAARGQTEAFRPTRFEDTRTFRFTFLLKDVGVPQGASASTEFNWIAATK